MEKLRECDPLTVAGIAVIAFGINFLATYEVQRIQHKDAFRAALACSANVLLGSILLYAFVQNQWYSVPEMVGSFAGTYLMTKMDRGEKK